MVNLKISAQKMQDIIKTIQAEINKNPDGYIGIEFKSQDKDSILPAFYWSEDLGTPMDDYEFVEVKK
jgi:hypothetical protein